MIKTLRRTLFLATLLAFSFFLVTFAGARQNDYSARITVNAENRYENEEKASDFSGGLQHGKAIVAKTYKPEKPNCGDKPCRPDKNEKIDGSEIQFRAEGRVKGRRGVSEVLVAGDKAKNGEYVENIRIIVRDLCERENSETITIVPPTNYGYSPQVALVNFTEKGGNEIFYTAESGGSGAFTFSYVFSLKEGNAETIFDYEKMPNDYTARYEDCYKIAVKNTASGAVYYIDVGGRGEEYLGGIYNENGTLKAPTEAEVSAVNTVLPFFRGENGTYGLLILRRITGLYEADSFGYVQSFYGYGENGFGSYYEGVLINPSGN